jgi:hypothetical protein
MKYLLLLLLSTQLQAATLNLTLPTERENGDLLAPHEIQYITYYRNGVEYVQGDGSPVLVADTCSTDIMWTATATADNLESVHTPSIIQPRDEVGCAPKPPAGLSF